MSRAHWSDVHNVQSALTRVVLEIEALRAVHLVPLDQEALREVSQHVQGQLLALSRILTGQSRHVLPVFAKQAQSQQGQGSTARG